MDIEQRVREIVGRVLDLPPAELRLQASLKDDLGATSLDRYTILMDVEDAFGIELDDVPEEQLEQGIQTLADIVAFLHQCLDNKGKE